jgi:hypothetical protein
MHCQVSIGSPAFNCPQPVNSRSAWVNEPEPGRLRVAAHNLGEPMAVRPRVWDLARPGPLLTFRGKAILAA